MGLQLHSTALSILYNELILYCIISGSDRQKNFRLAGQSLVHGSSVGGSAAGKRVEKLFPLICVCLCEKCTGSVFGRWLMVICRMECIIILMLLMMVCRYQWTCT